MQFIDRFGRTIGNVRISLTDRCNLRCTYCMPEDGIEWLEKSEILSFEEITRLVGIFYNHGVRNFRLTGGEPLVRNDILTLIEMLKTSFPDIDLAMTTNGVKLKEYASDLAKYGLERVNISLDTLDHQKFQDITKRTAFHNVLEGIKSAISAGLKVKINAVALKDFNDDIETLNQFIKFSDENGIEIRFIEIMPFTGNHWKDQSFIPSEEIRRKIENFHKLVKLPLANPSSTSVTWRIENTDAKLGFISSVSESFCHSCNRVRITSDGKLRPCLHNAKEYDLKYDMRSGATDEILSEIIQNGLNKKWKEHPDFLALSFSNPIDDREMIRIGG